MTFLYINNKMKCSFLKDNYEKEYIIQVDKTSKPFKNKADFNKWNKCCV